MHTRHVTIGGPDTGNMRLTMAILDGVARRHDKARQREARRARMVAWMRGLFGRNAKAQTPPDSGTKNHG